MKTIDYCVALVQQDLDDYSAKMRKRILQFGINTYRHYIQTGIAPTIEVFYAKPDSLGQINLPDDYEYYTKVAVIFQGRVITLTLNKNMPFNNRLDSCGDDIIDAKEIPLGDQRGGYPFVGHYRAGNYVGELYGMGGGINRMGYFNENKRKRQIQVINLPLDEVVIEYVSSSLSGGTIVDDAAVGLIRYGTHQQITLHDAKETQVRRNNMEQEFNKALDHYVLHSTVPTIDEFLDMFYLTTKSSPKR
jgi:hypothetical protein